MRMTLMRPLGASFVFHLIVFSCGIELTSERAASSSGVDRRLDIHMHAQVPVSPGRGEVTPAARAAPVLAQDASPALSLEGVSGLRDSLSVPAAHSAFLGKPPASEPSSAIDTAGRPPLVQNPAESHQAAGRMKDAGERSVDLPDEESLRGYRMQLAIFAKRYKRYPEMARERQWEGTVEVRVRYAPSATLPQVDLGQSSGYRELDEAAVGMVTQAVRQSVLPEPMRRKGFQLLLPIQYRLEG